MSNSQDLLFEIGCEELPPKSLNKMAESLLRSVTDQLSKLGVSYKGAKYFSSPRRLAFIIESLANQQPDKSSERLGPPVASSFDDCGVPTNAAVGFAKSCGTTFENLDQVETPKGKRLAFVVEEKGKLTASLLPQIIESALKKLPIPKMMRWGDFSYSFVRPVHWILFLYGEEVVDIDLYGKQSSNVSYGHRFISPGSVKINSAEDYVDQLFEAHVVVDVSNRKQIIKQGLDEALEDDSYTVLVDDDLLDEVSSIVEYPYPLVCSFDQDFLRVPQESLITAMQSHQKCFPVLDKAGRLVNKFITVCNINSENPEIVIQGNERVMAARLSDAAFFYDSDVKTPLEKFSDRLENVTFQKQLGSTQAKVERITKLAVHIADKIQADKDDVRRAGMLSKADLMTDMVFEFPELQGLMGFYYAKAQNESQDVAIALNEQYMPKFSGDELPKSKVGICLSLADKVDTLVGIFGIGQKPTGDKDPFALRRAVIGVLRILKESGSDIELLELLRMAKSLHQAKLVSDTVEQVEQFAYERLKGLYKEDGVDFDVFDAVVSVKSDSILDFDKRIQAILSFKKKEEAADLSQANKRISNILSKNNITRVKKVNDSILVEDSEKKLYKKLISVSEKFEADIEEKLYLPALDKLCELNTEINNFFDKVMVMDKDDDIRNNRIALLSNIQSQFKQAADISKLVI